MRLKRQTIKNISSVDVSVKDAYGKEYMLFPHEEKELTVFEQEKQSAKRRSNRKGKG